MARVVTGFGGLWCGDCVYDVEEKGEPVDSTHARELKAEREAGRAKAARAFGGPS